MVDFHLSWSEQGVSMTVREYNPIDEPIIDGCNFSYGSGSLSILEGFFILAIT